MNKLITICGPIRSGGSYLARLLESNELNIFSLPYEFWYSKHYSLKDKYNKEDKINLKKQINKLYNNIKYHDELFTKNEVKAFIDHINNVFEDYKYIEIMGEIAAFCNFKFDQNSVIVNHIGDGCLGDWDYYLRKKNHYLILTLRDPIQTITSGAIISNTCKSDFYPILIINYVVSLLTIKYYLNVHEDKCSLIFLNEIENQNFDDINKILGIELPTLAPTLLGRSWQGNSKKGQITNSYPNKCIKLEPMLNDYIYKIFNDLQEYQLNKDKRYLCIKNDLVMLQEILGENLNTEEIIEEHHLSENYFNLIRMQKIIYYYPSYHFNALKKMKTNLKKIKYFKYIVTLYCQHLMSKFSKYQKIKERISHINNANNLTFFKEKPKSKILQYLPSNH